MTAADHLACGKGCCVGCDLISLPVNDDWVRGGLISVAATFLLTTAAEWAVKERKEEKVSHCEKNKLNRRSHHLSGPSTSTNPHYYALQSAKTQDHTKGA